MSIHRAGRVTGYSRSPNPIPDAKHGTITGYTYYGCRCAYCKAAAKVYNAQQYAKRTAEP